MNQFRVDVGSIQRLVVGLDGSPASEAALGWAIREAGAHCADLDVIHAYHAAPSLLPARAEDALDSMVDHMVYRAVDGVSRLPRSIDQVIVNAPPARTLLQVAADSDVLAIGARGCGGFAGRLFGSVARQCVRQADCPVVVVPARPSAAAVNTRRARRGRIVVGVDGSASSRAALAWAVREATAHGSRLQVVHAWHPPYITGPYAALPTGPFEDAAAQVLDEALDSVGAGHLAVSISRVSVCGSAAGTLTRLAERAELIVVGSRRLGNFASLVAGSVSERCAHDAPCPVMIVPVPEP